MKNSTGMQIPQTTTRCGSVRQMASHGTQISRKQEEAIVALQTHWWSAEEAALAAGISVQKLYRWLKDPDFKAAYDKAADATYRQAISRLQHSAPAFVSVLVAGMRNTAGPPSARVRACDRVLRCAKTAREAQRVAGRFADVKHLREARMQERLATDEVAAPAGERGISRSTGHGAKFPRRYQAAIIALLTHRNIPEAARTIKVSTQTLYRWMADAEFAAAYLEARLAAYGLAVTRLLLVSPEAVTTLQNFAGDPRTTPTMRVRAASIALSHANDASEEDIEACGAPNGSRTILTVLNADRRMFADLGDERPRVAA
jgi:hypothetical protein